MTSFPQTSLLSEVDSDEPLSLEVLEYFRARLNNRLHSLLLEKFLAAGEDEGVTKAKIARRLGRDPGQITRLLSGPANLQLKTISDILLALRCELDCTATVLSEKPPRNYHGVEWLSEPSGSLRIVENFVSQDSDVSIVVPLSTEDSSDLILTDG